jgi:hypothetical protein
LVVCSGVGVVAVSGLFEFATAALFAAFVFVELAGAFEPPHAEKRAADAKRPIAVIILELIPISI